MKRVVVTEKIHPDGLAILKARNDVAVEQLPNFEAATMKKAFADAHGILVRTVDLTGDILADTPELQVVSRHGVGCDNIDVPAMTARKIPVAIAATANSTSVVEHVIMMLMMLTKQPVGYDTMTREGRFGERGSLPTSEVAGKTILIVGYGRIGTKLAPVCKAMGMRVIVADIALNRELAAEQGVEGVEDFRPMLSQADVLSMHVPLNDSTRDLIGAAELAAMPDHALVINCARGGIVNESAVADAVRNGTIAGTGADVFSTEPPAADNPLLGLPNSILSPHSAAVTAEGAQRMATEAAQNILDHFDGKLTPDYMFNAKELGLA